jgi:hypothetical protein
MGQFGDLYGTVLTSLPHVAIWPSFWDKDSVILVTVTCTACSRNVYDKYKGGDGIDNDEFRNAYFEYEGWWELQLIDAYDLTGEQKYLDIAESLVHGVWETSHTCESSISRSSNKDTLTTIENVCRLSAAVYLTTRVDDAQCYQEVTASASGFLQDKGV